MNPSAPRCAIGAGRYVSPSGFGYDREGAAAGLRAEAAAASTNARRFEASVYAATGPIAATDITGSEAELVRAR